MALLQPVVDERLKRYNDNPDNELPSLPVRTVTLTTVFELMSQLQDDVITWLIQVSRPEDRNLRSICLRILVLNFASLHTSAQVCLLL